MPLYKETNEKLYSIYIWEVAESEKELTNGISELEVFRIFKHNKLEKRRIEKLAQAHLLLRANIDPLLVSYSQSGKPLIETFEKHISFSHSGKFVVLMVSDLLCGIDIEKENPKIIKVSPKFLADFEKKYLQLPGALTWIWCIKEAVFKYFGNLVFFKSDIKIEKFNPELMSASVLYKGVHGSGKFEIKLDRIENYYLAYTKEFQYT